MSKTTEIKVRERGNGWPDEGDTYHDGDVIYRIDEYFGPIHTDGSRGNYIWAKVEEVESESR
jgi:hypothetical protein